MKRNSKLAIQHYQKNVKYATTKKSKKMYAGKLEPLKKMQDYVQQVIICQKIAKKNRKIEIYEEKKEKKMQKLTVLQKTQFEINNIKNMKDAIKKHVQIYEIYAEM